MGGNEKQVYKTGTSHRIGKHPVHILIYTDVDPHAKMAKTRMREIERDHPRDRIFVKAVNDLSRVKDVVAHMTNYGPTREFAVWSHAARDGPKGEKPTGKEGGRGRKASYDPEVMDTYNGDRLHNQLYLDEWASIDFNWAPLSFAVFYGCQTAMGCNWNESSDTGSDERPTTDNDLIPEPGHNPEVPFSKTAFAYNFLERHPGLFAAAGQPWYTMPSGWNEGKQWEYGEYDSQEAVYSVAYQGSEDYQGNHRYVAELLWHQPWRKAYYDEGHKMRLFYKVPATQEEPRRGRVVRMWPNITTEKIENVTTEKVEPKR